MTPAQAFTAVVADDVPELRRLLKHVLEWSDRFKVVGEAENGEQAVALVDAFKPDLVLLDVSMPIMDGIEALPRIKETSPGTKVVILSGFEAERLARGAIAGGAEAYLEKGLPPALLISKLLGILDATAPAVPRPAPQAGEADDSPLMDVSAEEMMSLVAHEIRNPLAVIQGFGTELQNRWDSMPERQRKDAVKRMTERARYLNTVVNNLMFMRRLDSGHAWVEPSVEEVAPLVEVLKEELRELARSHDLEMEVTQEPARVTVDVPRLRQIMTNLVVNAAKFAPSNTPITVRARLSDGRLLISVEDRGAGVPDKNKELIFDKFSRLEKGGSGIGLGLFISRALAESMGGQLWVEDGDEQGAVFVLALPATEPGKT